MLPTHIQCENCGRTAIVRGCGRIEYDWPDVATADLEATTPQILSARLTVDCPSCGVTSQNYLPAGVPRPAPVHSAVTRLLNGRNDAPQNPRRISPRRPK